MPEKKGGLILESPKTQKKLFFKKKQKNAPASLQLAACGVGVAALAGPIYTATETPLAQHTERKKGKQRERGRGGSNSRRKLTTSNQTFTLGPASFCMIQKKQANQPHATCLRSQRPMPQLGLRGKIQLRNTGILPSPPSCRLNPSTMIVHHWQTVLIGDFGDAKNCPSGLQCQGMGVLAVQGQHELASLTWLLIFGEVHHNSVSCYGGITPV